VRRLSLTEPRFRAREAVDTATPARSATSRRVGRVTNRFLGDRMVLAMIVEIVSQNFHSRQIVDMKVTQS
jgi:hypothetical protein